MDVGDHTNGEACIGRRHLLGQSDPAAVECVNMDGASPLVLVCEHAGRAVPHALGRLGLEEAEFDRHIAFDVGAEGLARALSRRLDAPLVMQRFSRLVIDCNRPETAPDFIVEVSDGTVVPANLDLSPADRTARMREIHAPVHAEVAALLDRRAGASRPSIVVAVHSFTPRMRSTGEVRTCQLGLLFNRDPRFAAHLLAAFRRSCPGIRAEYNQPYTVSDLSDFTIPVHGERRGLPHVLLEVRSDEIDDEAGIRRWADMLARALSEASSTIPTEPAPCLM